MRNQKEEERCRDLINYLFCKIGKLEMENIELNEIAGNLCAELERIQIKPWIKNPKYVSFVEELKSSLEILTSCEGEVDYKILSGVISRLGRKLLEAQADFSE